MRSLRAIAAFKSSSSLKSGFECADYGVRRTPSSGQKKVIIIRHGATHSGAKASVRMSRTMPAPAAVAAPVRPPSARVPTRTLAFASTRGCANAAARLGGATSSSSSGRTSSSFRCPVDAPSRLGHLRIGRRSPGSIATRASDDGYAQPTSSADEDGFESYDKDWVTENADIVRAYPLVVGISSFVFILVNRAVSGISAVADASSSQTRADVLALIMAGTLILTGLTWISLKPKDPFSVELAGTSLDEPYVDASLTSTQRTELAWVWQAIQAGSNAGAAAIYYDGARVMQAGTVPKKLASTLEENEMTVGKICTECMKDGKSNYLANLALFPGRVEFVGGGPGDSMAGYMPDNTQAVVVIPIGEKGVMVCGSGKVRGFTRADLGWFTCLSEKLDVTLSGEMERSGLAAKE